MDSFLRRSVGNSVLAVLPRRPEVCSRSRQGLSFARQSGRSSGRCRARDPGASNSSRVSPAESSHKKPNCGSMLQSSPAFTFKFEGSSWQCFCGQDSLREYLDLRGHINIPSMAVPEFASWVQGFVRRQRETSSLFRQREVIRSILLKHDEEISEAQTAVEQARLAYQSLEACSEMEGLDAAARKLGLAIAGLEQYLGSTIPGSLPEYQQGKVEAAAEKLTNARRDQAQALEQLASLEAAHPERAALRAAESALESLYTRIGLKREEEALVELNHTASASSNARGTDFEDLSTHIVRRCFQGPSPLPSVREGETRSAVLGELMIGSDNSSASTVCVLSGVTLGLAVGEMDKLVVRVVPRSAPHSPRHVQRKHERGHSSGNPGAESANVDTGAHESGAEARAEADGGQTSAAGSDRPSGQGVPVCMVLPCQLQGSFDVTEVLAVVECKRNIDDMAYSFKHYQNTLAWLTGERDSYSADRMRTKFHFSGHFEKATVHWEDGVEFVFVPDSFHLFQKNPSCGAFLGRLVLIAFISRSRGFLCGLDSSAMGKLTYKLSASMGALKLLEDTQNPESMGVLHSWLMDQRQSSTSAEETLRLYLSDPLLACHVILVEQTNGSERTEAALKMPDVNLM